MGNKVAHRAAAIFAAGVLIAMGSSTFSYADVGKSQAEQVVKDRYGGQVISIESDSEKGQATWEVEVKNSPKHGRIEVDVAKSSGKIIACEAEDGEGSCPSNGTGGKQGDDNEGTNNSDNNKSDSNGQGEQNNKSSESGQTNNGKSDNNKTDNNKTDNGTDQNGQDNTSGQKQGEQVSPKPSGGADTGGGGTAGVEHAGVLGGGGGLIAVGAVGLFLLRRRNGKAQ